MELHEATLRVKDQESVIVIGDVVRQILERLEPGRDQVMLLHAGPDYFVGEGGGFSTEDLRGIRERVRYLALGHIHKPMLHGGWACNPGSPENCDLREAAYDDEPRGFAWIDLAPGEDARVIIGRNPRRPVVTLELDGTPFGNKLKDGPGALVNAAVKLIHGAVIPAGAVVQIRLGGSINLNRVALDLEALAVAIEQATGVTAVALDASGVNVAGIAAGAGGDEAGLSREALERRAISELVQDEPLWGLEAERPAMADLIFDLKEAVRERRSAEEIAATIDAHPLLETIRAARALP